MKGGNRTGSHQMQQQHAHALQSQHQNNLLHVQQVCMFYFLYVFHILLYVCEIVSSSCMFSHISSNYVILSPKPSVPFFLKDKA